MEEYIIDYLKFLSDKLLYEREDAVKSKLILGQWITRIEALHTAVDEADFHIPVSKIRQIMGWPEVKEEPKKPEEVVNEMDG